MRLIVIWVALIQLILLPQTPANQAPEERPRLEKLASWATAPTALAMQGNRVFLGQDATLERGTFDETGAMVTEYSHPLGYGRILAIASTPLALYVLTPGNLLVLDPLGESIWQTLRENGTTLEVYGAWLILAKPQERLIYQVQADGWLVNAQTLTSDTQLQALSFLPNGNIVKAEAKRGVTWSQLTGMGELQELGNLRALQNVDQLATQGTWTYTARGHILDLIDTQNAHQPVVASSYAPVHQLQDMVWQNGYLVIADASEGVKLYQAPSLDAPPLYLASQYGAPADHIVGANQVIIVSRADHIEFYDANRLPSLEPVKNFPVWDTPTALMLIPNSNRVLVGLGASGLAAFDFTNLSDPQLLGIVRFSAGVTALYPNPTDSTVVHILLDEGRLTTLRLNWADLSTSTILSDLPLAGYPTHLAYDATHRILAVASAQAATYFFQLDQTDPQLLFSYAATERMTQLAVNQRGEWVVVDGDRLLLLELVGNQTAHLLAERRLPDNQPVRLIHTPQGILLGQANRFELFTASANQFETILRYEAPNHYRAILPQGDQILLAPDAPAPSAVVLNVSNPRQPYEQAVINAPFQIDDWAISGNRLLLSSAQQGIMQWQGDLATLDQSLIQPTWIYQAPQQLDSLTQQPPQGAVGRDGHYFYQTQNGLAAQNLPPYHALIPFENGWLGIDTGFHLMRVDANGNILAQNTMQAFTQFAVGEENIIWVVDVQGYLRAVNLATLQNIDPPLSIKLDVDVTTLTVEGRYVLLGTVDGQLLRVATPRGQADLATMTVARLGDLGGAVQRIELHGTDLLVSAGRGGVWWLDATQLEQFTVKSHYQPVGGRATTLNLSPSQEWLVVSLDTCGMAILDARQAEQALPLYAQWFEGVVTDVIFLSETDLLVVVDGVPTRYRFNMTGQAANLPAPAQPNPPDKIGVEAPISSLEWYIPYAECQNLTYEVTLNSEFLTETSQPSVELSSPLYNDATWQITVQNSEGETISGPTWHIYTQSQGWRQAPLSFSERLQTDADSAGRSWPWYVLVGITLMVLGLAVWMVVQRYVIPPRLGADDEFD